MQNRQDEFALSVLASQQPVEFPLRPLFLKEAPTQDDYTESALRQPGVYCSPQTVADGQFTIIDPDTKTCLCKKLCQRCSDGLFVFACVADK
ncbi:MAG: hypothetical protein WB992_21580 [Bryobacteraceae bacterium]